MWWHCAGPGAVDYIIEHAEINFVFVQDKKVKQVRAQQLIFSAFLFNSPVNLFFQLDCYMAATNDVL